MVGNTNCPSNDNEKYRSTETFDMKQELELHRQVSGRATKEIQSPVR